MHQHDVDFLQTTLNQFTKWQPKNINKTYEQLLMTSKKYKLKGSFSESLDLFQKWREEVSSEGKFDSYLVILDRYSHSDINKAFDLIRKQNMLHDAMFFEA